MGMLDMVEALRWVQNNIEKFGGDPRQVRERLTYSLFKLKKNYKKNLKTCR